MLRTSERGSLKRCEFLWDIEFNKSRKPLVPGNALRMGSLIHIAMAGWYIPGVKRGVKPAVNFQRAYDAQVEKLKQHFNVRQEDETWVAARDLGIAMMENYVDEYGTDPDWEVLVTEQPFRVLIEHPDTGKPWFWYTGVLDGVWKRRTDKSIWIPDHKSSAGIGGTTAHPKMPAHLQMDDQAGAYWSFGVEWLLANGYLKDVRGLSGMLYNYMRKALPDERPSKMVKGSRVYLNKDGSVSLKQPSPYFARFHVYRDVHDREETKRRALVDFRRTELLRSGSLELSKSPGQFNCPLCWLRDICELHETGNDWVSMLKSETQVWDPYAEHEVYDGR